jgi:hypothetical protein
MSEIRTKNQVGRTSNYRYIQDGLLDILLAFAILFSAIVFSVKLFWLVAILPVVFSLIWITGKQTIMAPRMNGGTHFQKYPGNSRPLFITLTILGVIAFILGITIFWLFSSANPPTELRAWVGEYFLYICAVGVAFLLALIGLMAGIRRFYAYALAALIMGVGGPLINLIPFIYVTVFAMLMLLTGIFALLR